MTSVSGLLGLQLPQGITFDCCAVLILTDAYIINPRTTQSLRWLVMSETYDPLHIVETVPSLPSTATNILSARRKRIAPKTKRSSPNAITV